MPPVRNSLRNAMMQRRHRRVAVEESDVVTGIERRQHRREIAFVHGDAMIEAGGGDIVARKLHVLRVALDGVDHRIRRAVRERKRRVAERRAQFQDAPRLHRRRQRAEQRTVP